MTMILPLPGTNDPVQRVLERVRKVRQVGAGAWEACCPAHDDRTPSLSISVGRDGRALLHCHAGCTPDAICAALSLAVSDLFPPREELPGPRRERRNRERLPTPAALQLPPPDSAPDLAPMPPPAPAVTMPARRIVATYDYCAADGTRRFQVVRFDPKDFRQRRPDGAGGWTWNLRGIERILYRLPEVLAAVQEDRLICVVEGEKDADALQALGVTATTSPMGAGKWERRYGEALRGARVVLLPDHDEAGRQHMAQVAASLAGVAAEVRIVPLPGLPPKGDVSDWLAAGGTVSALRELVRATPALVVAPPATPPATPAAAAEESDDGFHLTDLGNAMRFVAQHGDTLRYIPEWGRWHLWDGRRWAEDRLHDAQRRSWRTALSIYEEAARAETKSDRQALIAHAKRSESKPRLDAILQTAASDHRIVIAHERFDATPTLLSVENGTLDLRTGALRPHRREDLITKLVPITYEAEAVCPRWLAFLDRVLAGDQPLIGFLQRAVGYSLTGLTGEQCLFFLHGMGANGKSTFLEVLRLLLGDYAAQTDFTTFVDRQQDGVRNDVARLQAARLVTASEVGEGKRLNESLIKSLTGSDMITARFLRKEFFEFRPQFKLWLAANHKPVVRGTDDAIWRRVHLIPFTVQIPPAERDPELITKLRDELPGILAWAVTGARDWHEYGLEVPDQVRAATHAYRAESDVLGAFLADTCSCGEGLSEAAKALYEAYKSWAVETGEHVLSQTAFGRQLDDRGFTKEKRGKANTTWRLGLRLLNGSDQLEELV